MRKIALRRLASVAAMPRCSACTAPCPDRALLCAGCDSELAAAPALISPGPPEVGLAVAAAEYEGAARAVAHGLKFARLIGLADVAALAIVRACPPAELRGSVVPVPAAPWRRRWRGFDPAEEIALALARLAGLEFDPCLRRSNGPRQVGRPRSERTSDPPRVRARGSAPPEAVLVDDVRTTGATLGACAAALRAAGCRRVVAVTFSYSR